MENQDGRVTNAALDTADVCAVEAGFESEVLLRPSPFLTDLPHIESHLLPNIHAPAGRTCCLTIYGL
jgi:hypothetical protein